MSPRSLTQQEKDRQYTKIFEKGKEVLVRYGLQKTSVDDIVKAAGIAKGTFYVHFKSKEEFVLRALHDFHESYLSEVERLVTEHSTIPLKERLRVFIKKMYTAPDFMFFLQNHEELSILLDSISADQETSIENYELSMFAKLLDMAGIDKRVVKPEVLHNYVHIIYFGSCYKEVMSKEYFDVTLDVLTDGLIHYIFGGENNAL